MTAGGDGTGQVRRPRTPRVLAVCAVLFGLFLMHGSPASAAGGCHGAGAPMAPAGTATSMAHQPQEAVAGTALRADHHTAGRGNARAAMGGESRAQVYDGTHPDHATCWATPARGGRAPLAAAGAAALHALGDAGGNHGKDRTPQALGGGWRGPPSAGRAVLLRLGVART